MPRSTFPMKGGIRQSKLQFNRLSKQHAVNAYISSGIYLTNYERSTFLLLQLPLAARSIDRSSSEKKIPCGLLCGSVPYLVSSCVHGGCSYLT